MRSNGVLMHISSLPSDYGIGTLGQAAYDYADFLKRSEIQYWQILPIGPTSYGDSPYQSYSSFAGNPYFIDLDMLCKDGYLQEWEVRETFWGEKREFIDYANMYDKRFPLLYKACDSFREQVLSTDSEKKRDFDSFLRDNSDWLVDFALYVALKDAHGGHAWYEWEDDLKLRKDKAIAYAKEQFAREIENQQILQYWFDRQWRAFREYLDKCEIKLIGDIPIYVAYDSVEVWVDPKLFSLNRKMEQVRVAGCPPDAFDANGQLWGNPIYEWKTMERDGYAWWLRRLRRVFELHDVVRIDHFRGFASYYSIPAEDEDAKNGKWEKGPGIKFFEKIKSELGDVEIIAEDLGFITEDVNELLAATGYPGMKVLQFAFGDWLGNNIYLPHNHERNSVVYTGTHDNNTTIGWYYESDDWIKTCVKKYLNTDENEGINWGMIRGAYMSHADLAIIQMQDFLGFGSDCRMNTPSQVGENWKWRLQPHQVDDALSDRILDYLRRFGRASWRPVKEPEETDEAVDGSVSKETEA